jgi:hypothetical protein
MVPAILRRIALCSLASSEMTDKEVHAKSYALRNPVHKLHRGPPFQLKKESRQP